MVLAPSGQVVLWHLLKDSSSHIIRRNISATINVFPHNRAFTVMILICLFSEIRTFLVTAWWLAVYGRQLPRVYLGQAMVGWQWTDIRISSFERSSKTCAKSLGKKLYCLFSASLCECTWVQVKSRGPYWGLDCASKTVPPSGRLV